MLIDRIPVRLRLSLAHAVWMGITFAGIGFGVSRFTEHHLYQSIDAALLTTAREIRNLRFIKGFGKPLIREFLQQYLGQNIVRSHAQLVDFSGRSISMSTDDSAIVTLPVTPHAISRAELGEETLESIQRPGGSTLRIITVPMMARGRFTGELIQVAAQLDSVQQTMQSINLMLWLIMPAGLLLSVVFGYWLTARSLRPVMGISRTASRLSADQLSRRLRLPEAKDEIRHLTITFNDMLNRLEDAFVRLRRFAGDVSHELRTPLAVLRGEAELALRKERTPEEYRKALAIIGSEAMRMTEIVEELLLLARAQGKAIRLNFEVVSIAKFCQQTIEAVQSILDEKSLSVDLKIHSAGVIEISPTHLLLALKNILLNAAKYSPSGTRIELEVGRKDNAVEFTISDRGEGIPEASLPYIFDPFYRVDSARNRANGGTGIGLSLALALVQLHGGRISVQSKIGEGSKFCINIPAAPQRAEVVDDSKKHPIRDLATTAELAPIEAV